MGSLSRGSVSGGICPWWLLIENHPPPVATAAVGTHPTGMHSYLTRFLLITACLAQFDQHQTCEPVMVSVVSSNPTGGNFIFFKTPRC